MLIGIFSNEIISSNNFLYPRNKKKKIAHLVTLLLDIFSKFSFSVRLNFFFLIGASY